MEVLFFDGDENPVFTSDPCQKATCPIYGGGPRHKLLPPALRRAAVAQPTFYAPEGAGERHDDPLDGLWGYVVNFDKQGALTG